VLKNRIDEAVIDAANGAVNDAIALSALGQFLDRSSIEGLGRVLGLTHSGAVRLVDRLTAAGLVTRDAGADGRTVAVTMTSDGRAVAEVVTQARQRVLSEALTALPREDQRTLDRLLGRLLVGLMRGPGATRWICRLCNLDACGRPTGGCPVAEEARRCQL